MVGTPDGDGFPRHADLLTPERMRVLTTEDGTAFIHVKDLVRWLAGCGALNPKHRLIYQVVGESVAVYVDRVTTSLDHGGEVDSGH